MIESGGEKNGRGICLAMHGVGAGGEMDYSLPCMALVQGEINYSLPLVRLLIR